jgi:hypothetical protein
MSKIAAGKSTLAAAIEDELDALAADIRDLVARAREAGKDARGLNDLGAGFNGLASTLEVAAGQVEDIRTEARAWLGAHKEPITERTNAALLGEIRGTFA